jgi:hypothetical protein
MFAGLGRQADGVDEAHRAGGAVGVLAARSAAGDALLAATGDQRRVGQGDVGRGCGRDRMCMIAIHVIVAHLPDGICRIRITTEPMFSRSEFVPLVLESMLEGENRLVLDLGLVAALHSPSLANLVTIHIALIRKQREMILAGVHERNRKILAITKLDRLFTLDPPVLPA